ncbi:HNH endonuclease signature motif containing protein [Undibacterium sp. CY21W]|uniref:HNH endonuclease n=1 Tax=Undibacterium sp. CY21W TaxID=2762293 RepID=UPI00164A4DC1|nr:HNH endonuclease [Undibacterium sp. CY21W]
MITESIAIKEIVAYWSHQEDESGLAIDWSEAHVRCWRCAYKAKLQRCHIIPASRGGPASVENLVLLCGRCHREAPNVSDSRLMWIWLRASCLPFYDMYWTVRGAEEFENMFGRLPFSTSEFSKDMKDVAVELLRTEIGRATIHWGEGRLNPSTIASIFALVEEKLTGLEIKRPASSAISDRFFRYLEWLPPR